MDLLEAITVAASPDDADDGRAAAAVDALAAVDDDRAVVVAAHKARAWSGKPADPRLFAALERALDTRAGRAAGPARAAVLLAAGVLAFRRGDQATARARLDESAALARAAGDDAAACDAAIGLAKVALRDRDALAVHALCDDALARARRIDDAARVHQAVHHRAEAQRMTGDLDGARASFVACIDGARAARNAFVEGVELMNLAGVERGAGRLAEAERLLRAGLDVLLRNGGDDVDVAYFLVGMGAVRVAAGRLDVGVQLVGAGLATMARLGVKLDPAEEEDVLRTRAAATSTLDAARVAALEAAGGAMSTTAARGLADDADAQ